MLASVLDRMFDLHRLIQTDELDNILEQHLASSEAADVWEVRKSPPWTYVQARPSEVPEQGWKIHLSATMNSAAGVLAAVLPILLQARTCFKFIMNLRLLRLMNSPHAPRAASGKFVTVYPERIETFRELIAELSEATASFKGPAILSDKPFRPGGLVHYRYGGFKPLTTYDDNGIIVYSLRGPDGTLVSDIRSVSSRVAEWVVDPFAVSQSPAPQPHAPSSIALRGRYLVTHAIRHANKGGVYLATDRVSGDKVVIKEARPNVATDQLDRDATDRLRGEAEVLEKLCDLGLAPRPIELFWEGGHLFLALEWLPGRTLREYVVEFKKKHLSRLPKRKLLNLSCRVAKLLERCHANGMVIRDFSPNNVMVTPRGRLFLIDLELAARVGEENPLGMGEGTPGYASPQQFGRAPVSFEDDYFSLGGILFFLTTLRDPVFPSDEPDRRTLVERVRCYLEVFFAEQGLHEDLMLPIVSNLHPSPEERWSPGRVLRYLSTAKLAGAEGLRSRRLLSVEKTREEVCRLASAVLDQITASLDFKSPTRPFLPTCLGESSHPCNVQHGTVGIGMSLLAHAQSTGNGLYFETLHELARWTIGYLDKHPDAPPGLYFGTAGSSWFLLDAATLLNDKKLFEASIAM
ncbi:MAG TPA: hypothetical protein VKM72_05715, partial [Thermoanaerobaculia bacterium]|nr:hypothetical protein [Thermoanaerobaculia bacterium]